MTTLTIALLIIIVFIGTYGVFSCWYKDTLLQCIGLVTINFGACSQIFRIYYTDFVSAPTFTIILGTALYLLGTFVKHMKRTKPIRDYYARRNHKTVKTR